MISIAFTVQDCRFSPDFTAFNPQSAHYLYILKNKPSFAALMKHIVTLSLVFFSLTHLAKAEQRVEGLRLLTERYCNRQQVSAEDIVFDSNSSGDYHSPFFLSYNELTLIGTLPQAEVAIHSVRNHHVTHLTTRKNAKNNSP